MHEEPILPGSDQNAALDPIDVDEARRYRELFADAQIGIYFSRPGPGGIISCNLAFARMLGFGSVKDAIGADASFVYTSPEQRETLLAHLQEHGRLEYYRGPLRRKDGSAIEVISSVVAAFDKDGIVSELRGFVVDISASAEKVSALRARERRLVQSEKIESVGRLAGGIAHDFNNLLTAILGYTELLIGQKADDDPDRPDLEEIQKAGQRAAALTQQLLAYSRKQVLRPKEVDLNQTVCSLQGMLTRLIRADITLTYELAPIPALVTIDPTQLEQVILNLVLNSRDALPAGGSIRLEVAHARVLNRDVPSDQPIHAGEYVRLRVIDDGVGIPPEARTHIFEPFFTTKELGKGTGLGLASVYGIVRQSNGFISVESGPGLGTTFTMHFPSVGPIARTDEMSAAVSTPAGGRETILLVEDEDAVRVIVGAALRRQGYQVLEASTPSGAYDIFTKQGSTIDLLLTDVVMPEMNGPALAQRLVAARPELRVLFISGYADMASLDVGNPNISFLSKPFQASVLAAKVRDVLTRSPRSMN